ncbi:uncharacterized protein VTP21DRAFT_430 [Calcarisporiella thermophila]|uniref:uncharacterized protein n=1 Tax=Calcarisporiella thermophila TaxID=911321 RepID=UPI00374273B5
MQTHQENIDENSSTPSTAESSRHAAGDLPAPHRTFSTKSCLRCREKKVRCEMGRPVCVRCKKAKAQCVYVQEEEAEDMTAFINSFSQRLGQVGTRVRGMEERWERVRPKLLQLQLTNGESIPIDSQEIEQEIMGEKLRLALPPNWQLIQRPEGIRIQTNILNLTDLYSLVQRNLGRRHVPRDMGPLRCRPWCGGEENSTELPVAFVKQFGMMSIATVANSSMQPYRPQTLHREIDSLFSPAILNDLVRIYLRCCMLYRDPDPLHFYKKFVRNKLDPLVQYSVLAYAAQHAYFHHHHPKLLNHDLLPLVAEAAFNRARELLEDRFDDPSLDTLHGLVNLYLFRLFDKEDPFYLELARQMVNIIPMHHAEMLRDPLVAERFNRLRWGVSYLEYCKAVMSTGLVSYLDPLDSHSEPKKRPGQSELDNFVIDFITVAARVIKKLYDFKQVRKSPVNVEESILQMEAIIRDVITSMLPARIRINVLQQNVPSPYLGYIVESQSSAHMFLIQVYKTIFSKLSLNTQWSDFERHAYDVCIDSANMIVDLIARMTEAHDFCRLMGFFDALQLSFYVHSNVLMITTDADELQRTFIYLNKTLDILRICLCTGLQQVISLQQKVEEFLAQKSAESLLGASIMDGVHFTEEITVDPKDLFLEANSQ